MTTRSPVALAALALTLMLFVASTANAVGPGKTCGGFIGIPCDGGAFCDKPAGACGVADGMGKCAAVPQVCNLLSRPVCGCDGKTYGNDCARRIARVSKNHDGRCRS
jgi:hypothetical protein